MRGIFWLAEHRFASQEELCSVKCRPELNSSPVYVYVDIYTGVALHQFYVQNKSVVTYSFRYMIKKQDCSSFIG